MALRNVPQETYTQAQAGLFIGLRFESNSQICLNRGAETWEPLLGDEDDYWEEMFKDPIFSSLKPATLRPHTEYLLEQLAKVSGIETASTTTNYVLTQNVTWEQNTYLICKAFEIDRPTFFQPLNVQAIIKSLGKYPLFSSEAIAAGLKSWIRRLEKFESSYLVSIDNTLLEHTLITRSNLRYPRETRS